MTEKERQDFCAKFQKQEQPVNITESAFKNRKLAFQKQSFCDGLCKGCSNATKHSFEYAQVNPTTVVKLENPEQYYETCPFDNDDTKKTHDCYIARNKLQEVLCKN